MSMKPSLTPLATIFATALILGSHSAFAGFSLIDENNPPSKSSSALVASDQSNTVHMKAEIARLQNELASLRKQLFSAQADATRSQQELLAIRAQQDSIQQRINKIAVAFAFGTSVFAPTKVIGEQLISEANRSSRVNIFGYTDSLGTIAANQRVAELRAQAAKNFLTSNGVPGSKVFTAGRAGEYAESNTTAQGRAANRRVVFEFHH